LAKVWNWKKLPPRLRLF